jgi:hypothetical protein
MTPQIKLNVGDVEKGQRRMRQFQDRVQGELALTIDSIVREIAAYARDIANFADVTGQLRKSIEGVIVELAADIVRGQVRATKEYALHVEGKSVGKKGHSRGLTDDQYHVISQAVSDKFEWAKDTLLKSLSRTQRLI